MIVYYWLFVVFVLGAVVGSFLNVVIARLPLEKSIIWPGSRCGKCLAPIRWYDNIPLFSYLRLRGRCRACGQSFSIRYFLVELLVRSGFCRSFLPRSRSQYSWLAGTITRLAGAKWRLSVAVVGRFSISCYFIRFTAGRLDVRSRLPGNSAGHNDSRHHHRPDRRACSCLGPGRTLLRLPLFQRASIPPLPGWWG